MASSNSLPLLQKGSPKTLRSAERANELIGSVNKVMSGQIRITTGPSRIDFAGESMMVNVGIDDVISALKSRGYLT